MSRKIEAILNDFVLHVIDLKAEDDPAGTGFHREFRVLREEQIQNKNEERFPTDDGRREENLKKNRYKDILPRDDRRVKLTEIEGENGSDYINASFIDDVNGEMGYIASQGPMPHTVNDFWRMLWEYNIEIVFMACKLKEDGRPKCEKYWADNGENATFGDITVYTESEEEIQEHFVRRQLRFEKDGESHTLTQFHYVGWPDHNTPSSPDALRTMIEDVRKFRKHLNIPMVVHCSAGCGRTGTICAIDYAWTLLDRGMIKDEFSMFEIIKSMREQRVSMVQTPDQYEYTHMVMKSLCKEWLQEFAVHDYENIDIGKPPSQEEDESDEVYANVGTDPDAEENENHTETSREKVITMPEVTREVEKLVASAPPTTETAAPAKPPRPVEDKPTPEEQREHKPQAGDRINTTSSRSPARMSVVDQPVDSGEYVEVSLNASSPPPAPSVGVQKVSTSSEVQRKSSTPKEVQKPTAAVATERKTSAAAYDNADACKTVIMLEGKNASPQIVQTGSVGVSKTKQQAPKPPAQAVVKQKEDVEVVNLKDLPQRQTSLINYENVEISAISSSDTDRQNSVQKISVGGMSDEEGPDLPSRNYKPEEISSLPNSPTTKAAPQAQEPIIVTHPVSIVAAAAATKVSPTSPKSPTTSQPPFADKNRDRAPQPLPTTTTQGVQVVRARSAGHVVSSGAMVRAISSGQPGSPRPVGPGHQEPRLVAPIQQQQHQHPRPVGHQTMPPGMVSVMVGASHHQPTPHRQPVLVKSADTRSLGRPTQPVVIHMHNKGPAPRHQGPMMMQHHSHPGMRGQHAVPGQVVGGPGQKIIYLTGRPDRVRGPKNMPPGWGTQGKNHRGGTYL
ncbi:uncharacterized protein LOC143299506 isoform X2 [Babylonia areolata]|uniref:uncharacterized protein LOC143299506 isoform X2 n=1 Tax=Babylonia areolata TaxID=304850 RepID=UPI003FD4144B